MPNLVSVSLVVTGRHQRTVEKTKPNQVSNGEPSFSSSLHPSEGREEGGWLSHANSKGNSVAPSRLFF